MPQISGTDKANLNHPSSNCFHGGENEWGREQQTIRLRQANKEGQKYIQDALEVGRGVCRTGSKFAKAFKGGFQCTEKNKGRGNRSGECPDEFQQIGSLACEDVYQAPKLGKGR